MSHCSNMKIYAVLVFLVMGALADGLNEEAVYKDALRFVGDCGAKRLSLCLKEKALKFIERLPNDIDIGNGIRIKQSDSERLSREYTPITSLPEEAEEREAVLDRMLVEKIVDYLSTHTLELNLPILVMNVDRQTDELVEEARKKDGGYGGYGGGKKRKGGKKGGMGMMMMFAMKSAAMYAIALKVIGAIAFKALLVAKIALTVATIVALKKLVDSGKSQSSTYEVIAHSAHDDGGHDRVYSPADLMYRGYRPPVPKK